MEDNKIKNIVEEGLYQKAPTGMMDRIMANLVVNPVRRLSIKPVEPKPIFAVLVPVIMAALLALGAFLKPKSLFSSSWNLSINISMNPVWVAPVIAISIAIWIYIIIMKRKTHHS